MKKYLLIASVLVLASCSPKEWEQVGQTAKDILMDEVGTETPSLTDSEVAGGLKEALTVGIKNAAGKASATDGFWRNPEIRIPFPEEAIKVRTTLSDLGMHRPVADFEESLNHAAEEASKEAVPVFVNAITSMSFSDAWGILRGNDFAATEYLREKTTPELRAKFNPIAKAAIEKVQVTKYWNPLVTKYNSIPLVDKVNPDLEAYVTTKAIDGLFLLVKGEERKIRKDPVARVSDLLKKVFAEQDKK